MARIVWSERARTDFRRVIDYIARDSKRSAVRWARKIAAAVNQLKDFPEIGSPVEDFDESGLREQIVGQFRVVYHSDRLNCLIVAFLRAEQDLRHALDPGP